MFLLSVCGYVCLFVGVCLLLAGLSRLSTEPPPSSVVSRGQRRLPCIRIDVGVYNNNNKIPKARPMSSARLTRARSHSCGSNASGSDHIDGSAVSTPSLSQRSSKRPRKSKAQEHAEAHSSSEEPKVTAAPCPTTLTAHQSRLKTTPPDDSHNNLRENTRPNIMRARTEPTKPCIDALKLDSGSQKVQQKHVMG